MVVHTHRHHRRKNSHRGGQHHARARTNENLAPHLLSAPDQVQRHDLGPAVADSPTRSRLRENCRTPSTWTGGDHRRSYAHPGRHRHRRSAGHAASAPTHQTPLRSGNHPLTSLTPCTPTHAPWKQSSRRDSQQRRLGPAPPVASPLRQPARHAALADPQIRQHVVHLRSIHATSAHGM